MGTDLGQDEKAPEAKPVTNWPHGCSDRIYFHAIWFGVGPIKNVEDGKEKEFVHEMEIMDFQVYPLRMVK